jgi:GntR family transcriptional regulator
MPNAGLKRSGADSSRPLYVQLATVLGERIASGAYPIGDLLPTEAELVKSFGVSRYTVRQAIQHLRTQGLVSARKGVGTRVDAAAPEPSYTHSVRSLDDLLQYARQTILDVAEITEISARGPMAVQLGCRPGKRWLRARGVRYTMADHQPVCCNEIWVDAAYSGIKQEIGKARTAICALIESRYGETVVEIEQEIRATTLSQAEADQLMARAGDAALTITRRYFVTGRRLVELAFSVHPADRFTHTMTIRRGGAE